MKGLILCFIIAISFASCGNSNDDNSPTETPTTTTVENVNGNVPDTTNSATVNRPMEVDSLSTDSVRH